MSTIQIPLTLGQVATINLEDLPLISGRKWQAHRRRDGKGYYAVNSSGLRMHRMLCGVWDSRIVDHRNGDGLDNRRCNIRIGTQSLNSVNRLTTPGPYLRGCRPKFNKWRATIKHGGKQRSLGYFDTEQEAHQAYLAEAARLYGDWMPLPSPPMREK